VPATEPGAGTRISMQLLDELILRVQPRAGAAPEIWQRCDLQISLLRGPTPRS
jgi:hypothetical protein